MKFASKNMNINLLNKIDSESYLCKFRSICAIVKNQHWYNKSKYEQITDSKPCLGSFYFSTSPSMLNFMNISSFKTVHYRKSLSRIPYFLQSLTFFREKFYVNTKRRIAHIFKRKGLKLADLIIEAIWNRKDILIFWKRNYLSTL